MFVIRDYRPQDFRDLLRIDKLCFPRGISYSGPELQYYIAMPNGFTLVAERQAEAGAIAGFLVAESHPSRTAGTLAGHIVTIDVLQEHRRSGLGSLLMDAAETRMRDTGCTIVRLEVAVNNESAIRFYARRGYIVVKTIPRYYLDSIDALLMGKKL